MLNESPGLNEQIHAHCLRLLAIREHTQQELLQKLMVKGFPKHEIQPIITQLALQDWQSNQRYAESYARQRLNKGFGILRIRYELKLRGIQALDIDHLIEELCNDEFDVLLQTYQKKYPNDQFISRNEWAKRSRFLLQRGFSNEILMALFKYLQLSYKN